VHFSSSIFYKLVDTLTVVNSHVWNYEQSDDYSAHGGYDDKNFNSVHEMAPTTYNQAQPNSVLDGVSRRFYRRLRVIFN
jgi:hypothetical protein